MQLPPEFTVIFPQWFTDLLASSPKMLPSLEDRMRFVCSLARENVRQKTGGPFGAAIFDAQGNIISAGVNLVEANTCSILHAEMIAIALAQKKLGRYDLSDGDTQTYELVSSTEPCAMCFGAIPWSGVKRLVCGARDADARAIGFEEGPKLPNWREALNQRDIQVTCDILRDEVIAVLQLYVQSGGTLYNAGRRKWITP